ncbi:MAG: aminodeoxychorismate synthase component I [Spirosomaceae bacterium]|nr:aminodeoxychorismate synthase component I [Spirosomataceae bacterium]
MIRSYEKESAVKMMNFFGGDARPFIFIIDFDCHKNIILPLEEVDETIIRFSSETFYSKQILHPNIILHKYPISFSEYKKSFDFVYKNIHHGNSFLTNLTCSTPIGSNLSLEQIFEISEAKYRLWVKDQFVCFSPETFVKINREGVISSFPMKGTIDAALPKAELLILNDKKELFEHTTIVDLIRNDVSRVARKVWVEKFRFLDRIKKHDSNELLQVSSNVSGLLDKDWKEKLGEIIFKMLPAGSITGAPKDKTIEIIKKAESCLPNSANRNYYTGIFGIFDGESLDSGVLIRFIEQTEEGMFFKSGGGITFASDAEKEYNEMIQKIYVPTFRDNQMSKPSALQSRLSQSTH